MTSRRSRTHPSRCLDGERQLASARLNLYRENLAFREHWPRRFDARGANSAPRGVEVIASLPIFDSGQSQSGPKRDSFTSVSKR